MCLPETCNDTAHLLLVLQLPILLAADLFITNVARELANSCHLTSSRSFRH